MKKGGVIGMNKKVYTYDDRDFFEKRIDENYYLVLTGSRLKQLEQYKSVKGKKIILNDWKELNSLHSDEISFHDLYVVAVCSDKVCIYNVDKEDEWKYIVYCNVYIIAYKWLGFGKYRVFTTSDEWFIGNPQDGWVLKKEAI